MYDLLNKALLNKQYFLFIECMVNETMLACLHDLLLKQEVTYQ